MVDILLATYNSEKHIKTLLDSLLNQSYRDLRIIISDDCSTDSTAGILKEYEQKHKRLQVFYQQVNLGYIKNFEFLLCQSTGEYVCFADHDDFWYSTKVETMLNELIRHKVDLVYCDMRQIDENGKVLAQSYMTLKDFPKINGKNSMVVAFRHFSTGCSQLFSSIVLKKMLPFKDCVIAHDWLSIFVASRASGIHFIPKPLMDYRLHSGNVYGGKTTVENMIIAKAKYGKKYKGFLEYRKFVIDKNYLDGLKMCVAYTETDEPQLNKALKYFKSIRERNIISLKYISFYKYALLGKQYKRSFKEFIMLHNPLMAYIYYSVKG